MKSWNIYNHQNKLVDTVFFDENMGADAVHNAVVTDHAHPEIVAYVWPSYEGPRHILDRVSLDTIGAPIAEQKDGWSCITFTVAISVDSRHVITTPYSLGLGHFPGAKKRFPGYSELEACQHVARKYPKKYGPKKLDVLFSLFSDGGAFFYGETFEEWADDHGYSSDSIKAKAMFDACDNAGRLLARAFTEDELSCLQEFFQEY